MWKVKRLLIVYDKVLMNSYQAGKIQFTIITIFLLLAKYLNGHVAAVCSATCPQFCCSLQEGLRRREVRRDEGIPPYVYPGGRGRPGWPGVGRGPQGRDSSRPQAFAPPQTGPIWNRPLRGFAAAVGHAVSRGVCDHLASLVKGRWHGRGVCDHLASLVKGRWHGRRP